MKTKAPKATVDGGESIVCKTISLPKSLFKEADEFLQNDPELDFSKYIRKLIRADLESQKKPA